MFWKILLVIFLAIILCPLKNFIVENTFLYLDFRRSGRPLKQPLKAFCYDVLKTFVSSYDSYFGKNALTVLLQQIFFRQIGTNYMSCIQFKGRVRRTFISCRKERERERETDRTLEKRESQKNFLSLFSLTRSRTVSRETTHDRTLFYKAKKGQPISTCAYLSDTHWTTVNRYKVVRQ